MDINDRRPPRPLPKPEDYEKPLTRTSISEVNREYLQAGVRGRLGTDSDTARKVIRETTKDRFKARRRAGEEPLSTLGDYKEYLAWRADEQQ
jgi:hypothetical protein